MPTMRHRYLGPVRLLRQGRRFGRPVPLESLVGGVKGSVSGHPFVTDTDLVHLLFERSLDAIYIVEPSGSPIVANQAWLDLFGYDRSELGGLNAADVYADPGERDAFLRRITESGHVEDVVRFKRKDGGTFDCERRAVALRNESGSVVAIHGVHRDISAQQRLQEALRRSESFTTSVLDNLPIGIAVNSVAPTVTFEYVNDNFLRFYRTTREALASADGFWEAAYQDPVLRETMRKRVTEDCASGDPARMHWDDIPITRKGEPTTYVSARNVFIPEKGLMLSAVWDVTARNNAEQALRESEERFRSLFEHAMDAIFIASADGTMLEANQAWLDMFQYTRDELASLNAADVYIDPADSNALLQQAGETGYVRDEVRQKRKDGTVFDTRRTIVALRDPTGAVQLYEGIIYDASELKKAEGREQEQRFFANALMETSPACVLVFDASRKVVFANAETDRVLGLPRERVTGMTCGEDLLLLDSSGAAVPDGELPVCRVFLNEQPLYSTEYVFQSPTGRRVLSISAAPLYDETGAVVRVVATVEDITVAKHRERQLIESEQKFRSLFEQSMDAVALVAVDGAILEANDAFLKLFHEESFKGLNAGDYYANPADRERFRKRMEKEGFVYDDEHVLRRRDGSYMTCLRSAVARRDASGRVVAYQTVIRDITARKRAERELRESEEKYRSLFEQSMDAVALIAVDGTLLEANRAYLDLYGYDRDVIGKLDVNRHILQPGERAEFLKRLDKAGALADEEITRRKANGEIMICQRSAVARRDESGRMVAVQAVIRDITAKKRYEQEREQALVRLQSAMNGTVEAMSAAVEMRDPYTAGHQRRVTVLAVAMAREMGAPDAAIQALEFAGRVHDLGKLRVPAEILTKPTRLTPIEFQLIKEHPQASYDLLKGIDFPWPVADIAYQHHERLDGSGYPQGLKGSEMLPEARILAVADVFEAMSSHRPYRAALGPEAGLEELQRNRGTLYDPAAVDACVKLIRGGFALG